MEANHTRIARTLSRVMFGRAAEVSRLTPWSERMLQFWMEPHSRHRSPGESLLLLCVALRESGLEPEQWQAPLQDVCEILGGRFVSDEDISVSTVALNIAMADVTRRVDEMTDPLLRNGFGEDGLTEAVRQEFEAAYAELQTKLRLLRRKVEVAAGSGLRAVGGE